MKEEDIPDYNVFMLCERLNENALTSLREEYYIRNCRPDELGIWKAFPFDTEQLSKEYDEFMSQFFDDVYSHNPALFFENTLFVCDQYDKPIATCSNWKAYGKFNTIHWFKTLKGYEGKGIGRALLSVIMKRFSPEDYPILLHTQPGSFRAIGLYSDLGFKLLSGGQFGHRSNELELCLPILKEFIPSEKFNQLTIMESPAYIIDALKGETTIEF